MSLRGMRPGTFLSYGTSSPYIHLFLHCRACSAGLKKKVLFMLAFTVYAVFCERKTLLRLEKKCGTSRLTSQPLVYCTAFEPKKRVFLAGFLQLLCCINKVHAHRLMARQAPHAYQRLVKARNGAVLQNQCSCTGFIYPLKSERTPAAWRTSYCGFTFLGMVMHPFFWSSVDRVRLYRIGSDPSIMYVTNNMHASKRWST